MCDLVHVAVQCLKDIAKEEEVATTLAAIFGATTTESNPAPETSADKVDSHEATTDQCAKAQGSTQSSATAAMPSGAAAPAEESTKTEKDPVKDSTNWIARLVKEGHDALWPTGMAPTTGPTLLTGVKDRRS